METMAQWVEMEHPVPVSPFYLPPFVQCVQWPRHWSWSRILTSSSMATMQFGMKRVQFRVLMSYITRYPLLLFLGSYDYLLLPSHSMFPFHERTSRSFASALFVCVRAPYNCFIHLVCRFSIHIGMSTRALRHVLWRLRLCLQAGICACRTILLNFLCLNLSYSKHYLSDIPCSVNSVIIVFSHD